MENVKKQNKINNIIAKMRRDSENFDDLVDREIRLIHGSSTSENLSEEFGPDENAKPSPHDKFSFEKMTNGIYLVNQDTVVEINLGQDGDFKAVYVNKQTKKIVEQSLEVFVKEFK